MRYVVLFNPNTGDVKEVWIKRKREIRDLKSKGYREEYVYDDYYYGKPGYFTFYCKRCKEYHIRIHSFWSGWLHHLKWFLQKTRDCIFDIQIPYEKTFERAKKIFEIAYGKIPDEELAIFLREFAEAKYPMRRKFYKLLERNEEDKIIEEIRRFVTIKAFERLKK
ncbi:MAG: hypothetical protein J7K13_07120 [Thermoplasmata archaeon]|nr:hypothetical protein [Thermoplasmata archaeon]